MHSMCIIQTVEFFFFFDEESRDAFESCISKGRENVTVYHDIYISVCSSLLNVEMKTTEQSKRHFCPFLCG